MPHVGKSTRADFVDLLEVDAASRTKVDDTRELLDNVQYAPARGRFKVYLIDEVHMLSSHSFNALLKTLEEPPPHVKFLLATTDPQKLPVTVLSRCLQFNLKRLPVTLIVSRLKQIIAAEGLEAESASTELLARAADGSMRDALSLLDQLIAFGAGKLTEQNARAMLGTVDRAHTVRLLEQIAAADAAGLMKTVSALDEYAPDYAAALDELATLIQKVALRQAIPGYEAGESFATDTLDALAAAIPARGSAALLPARHRWPPRSGSGAGSAQRLRDGTAAHAGVPPGRGHGFPRTRAAGSVDRDRGGSQEHRRDEFEQYVKR